MGSAKFWRGSFLSVTPRATTACGLSKEQRKPFEKLVHEILNEIANHEPEELTT